MLEDKLLLRRFKGGSSEALCRIYEKYLNYLLSLAGGLLGDGSGAEDVVHDVFCSLIERRESIRLKGSLKGYLGTCVGNLSRDRIRARKIRAAEDIGEAVAGRAKRPDESVIWSEEAQGLRRGLGQLPYEQREAIVFHLRGGMKFREIARVQKVSVNTAKSRYRYGLDKLRALLNSEAEE